MKRFFAFVLALAVVAGTASTCDKLEPGEYRDQKGAKVNLIGGWLLSEVQYHTAGVVEKHENDPQTVMEFASDGVGYTKDIMTRNLLDSWHYEMNRGSVTIFTNEQWENNRALGEDDPGFAPGKTYHFRVINEYTLSSQEKVSDNSYVVNIFARYIQPLRWKDVSPEDEMFSPNTLLIMYDPEVGKEPLLSAIEEYGAEVKYDYHMIPGMAIVLPDGSDIRKAMEWFKKVKGVVSVERDQIIRLTDPVKPRPVMM